MRNELKELTVEERIEIANNVVAKAEEIEPKTKGAFRVWNGGENVRIYSDGNGFAFVNKDGSIDSVKRRQRAAGFPCDLGFAQLMVMKTSSGRVLVLKVSLRNFFREIEKVFIRRVNREPRNYEA